MNLLDLVVAASTDCRVAAPGLPQVEFTAEQATARVLLIADGLVRSRGLDPVDWSDVSEDFADDVRDAVFASRRVRFSSFLTDASEPLDPAYVAVVRSLRTR